MTQDDGIEKVARFDAAFEAVDRADRGGSLRPCHRYWWEACRSKTIWRRESLGLWIIEADGVSRRLRSDGNDERVFRILVENGINIHAEVIPRSRFKKMVEGRVADGSLCNFFARREIVYSKDASIKRVGSRRPTAWRLLDQERELLTFSTWTIHAHRPLMESDWTSRATLSWRGAQETLGPAQPWPTLEIIRARRGLGTGRHLSLCLGGSPLLFQTIYLDVLSKRKNRARVVESARRDRRVSRHALPRPT